MRRTHSQFGSHISFGSPHFLLLSRRAWQSAAPRQALTTVPNGNRSATLRDTSFQQNQLSRKIPQPLPQRAQKTESKSLALARLPSAAAMELLCIPPLQLDSNVAHSVLTPALYWTDQSLSNASTNCKSRSCDPYHLLHELSITEMSSRLGNILHRQQRGD